MSAGLPPRPYWLDGSHRVQSATTSTVLDVSHRVQSDSTSSSSTAMVDGSPRVQSDTNVLDVSHRVQSDSIPSSSTSMPDGSPPVPTSYTHEDDWERPTLGNKVYDRVLMPKSVNEMEIFNFNYPLKPAISTLYPLDALYFKKVSDTEIYVLFALETSGQSYDFTFPIIKSSKGMPDFLTIRECRETQWYYRYQPYLCFVPRENVFEGPIFGRFHGNRSYFETKVKGQGLQYIFDPDLSDSWLRVEKALLALIGLFYVRLQPLTAPRDCYPSGTKFFEPKPTVKKAVDAVLFAQKLVLQLIAELRYSIALGCALKDQAWLEVVQRNTHAQSFDWSWLADLAASKAMSTNRLAGLVVEPSQVEKGYHVHRFAHFGVPVYIPFAVIHCKVRQPTFPGQAVTHESDVKFKTLIDQKQLKHLCLPFELATVQQRIRLEWDVHYRSLLLNVPYEMPKKSPSTSTLLQKCPVSPKSPFNADPDHLPVISPVSPYHADQDPLPVISPASPDPDAQTLLSYNADRELPEPYPDSGQEPGQWWYGHHSHVKLCHDLGDDDETPLEQRKREQRERKAEQFRISTKLPNDDFKDPVFIWEPTDLHPTFLLRRRLSAKEVRGVWPSIPSSNKVYNSYNEEWDFYDPSCNLDTRTRILTIDNDPTEQDVEITRSIDVKRNPTSLQDDLKIVLRQSITDAISYRMPLFCEADPAGTAARRFGFLFPDPPLVHHHIKKKDQVQWYYHLGYKDVMLSNEKATQVEQTLYCLQNDDGDHLAQMLDIYLNPQVVMGNNTVKIRHFPNAEFEFSCNLRRNLYILSFPDDKRQDWFLGLSQASDLVFALREGWTTSRESLVEAFLVYGIQFYTLAPVPPPSEIPHFSKAPSISMSSSLRFLFPDAPFTMPLEPETGKYTVTDWFEYERRREQLFDKPYGRIAARSGGVVARLWRRDPSKFRQRLKDVLVGPTDLALWKGIRIRCGRGLEFYDDELRDITDGYICGQYQARKVDRSGVDDWHQLSWYSTNAAFNSRNKNLTSRWTHVDEETFIKGEEGLYDNFRPKSTNEWKKQARSKQGVLDKWIEKHCSLFLERYISTDL